MLVCGKRAIKNGNADSRSILRPQATRTEDLPSTKVAALSARGVGLPSARETKGVSLCPIHWVEVEERL